MLYFIDSKRCISLITLTSLQLRMLLKTDGSSLVAQTVKNLHAIPKTQVQSLDREDSLEKGMATHSSILAWRIPWTEEPGLQSMALQSWTQLSD